MKRIHLLAVALTASLVSACGGGGGSSSPARPPVVTPSQPPITVTISSTGLRVGTIGSQYSDTVVASASSGDVTITAQGSLPPGITLGNAGVLDGFPTQAGIFPVTFVATAARRITPSRSEPARVYRMVCSFDLVIPGRNPLTTARITALAKPLRTVISPRINSI